MICDSPINNDGSCIFNHEETWCSQYQTITHEGGEGCFKSTDRKVSMKIDLVELKSGKTAATMTAADRTTTDREQVSLQVCIDNK